MTRKTDQTSPRQSKKARAGENRRLELLEQAARLFSSQTYEGTSIRDIATAVGMLPGSIYYHFKSKEELMVAVHQQGVRQIHSAVLEAIARAGDSPWEQLTAASVAHLNALLGDSPYSHVVTPEFTRVLEDPLKSTLIAQRDEYEQLFESLVSRIPVPKGTSRKLLRLSLLGSLNWTLTWYRQGNKTPTRIAREMIDLYRYQLDESAIAR
jgi:TetR/AcrR family transcriptional regulator, cholesterol catabolism regulator